MRQALVLLLLVGLCGSAVAYNEPDNFLGLKFGQELESQLSQMQVPQCTASNYLDCYKRISNSFLIYNLGSPQRWPIPAYEILASSQEGKLTRVHFTSTGGTWLAILTQRYGEPTTKTVEPWQSKGGVKTTSANAVWRGKNVSIIFRERDAKINEGSVTIATEAWFARQRQMKDEMINKAVDALGK